MNVKSLSSGRPDVCQSSVTPNSPTTRGKNPEDREQNAQVCLNVSEAVHRLQHQSPIGGIVVLWK